MTVADVVILILVALTAFQGYVRGFLVGVMSLVGFLGGAFVGARIGPLILSGGANSPDAPLFGLGGALIAGSLLGAIFEGVARRGRRLLWLPGLRLVDGLLGALMAGCIGLGLVWIVGAVLLQTAHQFRLPSSVLSSITHSVILKNLNRALPPSGVILNALGHIDPLPSVVAAPPRGRSGRRDPPGPRRDCRYAGRRADRRTGLRPRHRGQRLGRGTGLVVLTRTSSPGRRTRL